ncbi:hypothetical protein ON010_g12403 [Phytophthora cinnamomi]|nr:hypothetical protein ON010_g12403 [Phytophthora cinnamomi]
MCDRFLLLERATRPYSRADVVREFPEHQQQDSRAEHNLSVPPANLQRPPPPPITDSAHPNNAQRRPPLQTIAMVPTDNSYQSHQPISTARQNPTMNAPPEVVPESVIPEVIPLDDSDYEEEEHEQDGIQRYPYVRVVRWIYNEDREMDAELQWENSIEPVSHLNYEDRV